MLDVARFGKHRADIALMLSRLDSSVSSDDVESLISEAVAVGLLTTETEPPAIAQDWLKWARRLKRVFGIEIETCAGCGGRLRIIASIEDAEVIARILSHLERMASDREPPQLPLRARAPPSQPKLL